MQFVSFFVYGEPNNVGLLGSNNVGLSTYREGITALDAILAVGGFDEFANEKR